MDKIWITRTEPGASELAGQLDDHGYDCLLWPVVDIERSAAGSTLPMGVQVDGAPVDARAGLAAPPQMVIALSGHAVRAFVDLGLQRRIADAKCIAVGRSTASLLEDVGIAAQTPQQATSEGVLQMPELARLRAGDRVWLLAGVGGRDLLERQLLSQYRVSVVKLELYRRVSRTRTPPTDAADVGAVVVASQQGLQAFAQMWQQMHGAMTVPVVVPSKRVADTAVQAGFVSVHCAEGADPQAVLKSLGAICDSQETKQ